MGTPAERSEIIYGDRQPPERSPIVSFWEAFESSSEFDAPSIERPQINHFNSKSIRRRWSIFMAPEPSHDLDPSNQ
jgi:hypothetical protein